MKMTGIVRRLDSLGRIVIPREYRKTHKIKESDPLEIIAMENGEIIIKKVDLSAELLSYGAPMLEHINEATSLCVMLSDGEKFLSGCGNLKNTFTDTILPGKVQNLLENRKSARCRASEMSFDGAYVCIQPVCKDDTFGGLFLFSQNEISPEHETVLKICARILADFMQKY